MSLDFNNYQFCSARTLHRRFSLPEAQVRNANLSMSCSRNNFVWLFPSSKAASSFCGVDLYFTDSRLCSHIQNVFLAREPPQIWKFFNTKLVRQVSDFDTHKNCPYDSYIILFVAQPIEEDGEPFNEDIEGLTLIERCRVIQQRIRVIENILNLSIARFTVIFLIYYISLSLVLMFPRKCIYNTLLKCTIITKKWRKKYIYNILIH